MRTFSYRHVLEGGDSIEVKWYFDFEDGEEVTIECEGEWERVTIFDGEYFEFRPHNRLLMRLEHNGDDLDVAFFEVGKPFYR